MKGLIFSAGLALGLVQFAAAQALVPGWETDPTAVKEAFGEDIGYQPPEALRYPYVSTYYVKPTVTPDEDVKIAFFVTDFEHSKVRFLDDSHRFTAYLEYRQKGSAAETAPPQETASQRGGGVSPAQGSASTMLTLDDLKSGDGEFNLGKLPVGEYELRVWAVDQMGRESHRVIQDFRVVEATAAVAERPPYQMTAADLAVYGIRNDGDIEKIVCGGGVVKEKRADVPGYTVTVPLDPETGKAPYRAYEKVSVAYDAGYDKAAVEAAAVKTAEGLQKLINEKAAAGYRKLVLHPGTYRVSHAVTLTVPDRFTLDLGEATIKLNQFAGESSLIFNIASAYDAHLVGGTVEGDYWAHDYAHSDKDSEWVSGIQIGGDSWYSSVENVKVVDITGYGGQNGIASDARGGLAFIYQYLPQFAAGGLDPKTGEVDTSDTYRFTTDFKDLTKVFEEIAQKGGRRRLQICKYLGYQGIRTRSWQMTVCWYDANKVFISSETCWQYREMWIPANAQYLRVSVEEGSVEAANGDELVITGFRLPVNCAVRNCTFEHCRCVGYAASAMRNMLFEGNFFTRSGEAEAKCAFDAEDGADQMQDVYFLRNRFRDNPINNSILTCAGHNFILEKNDGDIHFWGRTHSPCVRDNDVGKATYYCDSRLRSGYARFADNRYANGFKLGLNDMATRPDGWDYVLSERTIDGTDGDISIEIGKAGRAVGCTFRNLTSIGFGTAYACVIENCKGWCSSSHLQEVTVRGDSLIKPFYGSNFWENCHIQASELNTLGKSFFTGCDFTDALAFGLHSAHVEMTGCTFANSSVEGNWWEAPAEVVVRDSVIDTTGKPFLKLGVYTVGDVLLEGCTVLGAKELVNIKDLRRSNEDPGTLTLRDIAWESTAATVVTHPKGVAPGETLSTKEITLYDIGNLWPDGVVVAADLPATWQLVVKPLLVLGETAARPLTDYNGSEVSAAILGDIAAAEGVLVTLTLGGVDYEGVVDAQKGTVVFDVPPDAVTAGGVYEGTIALTVGDRTSVKGVTLRQGNLIVDESAGWIAESAATFGSTGTWSGDRAEVDGDVIGVENAVFTARESAPSNAIVTVSGDMRIAVGSDGDDDVDFDSDSRAGFRIVKVGDVCRYAFQTSGGVVTNLEVIAKTGEDVSVTVTLDEAAQTVAYGINGRTFGPYPAVNAAGKGVSRVCTVGEAEVASLDGSYRTETLDTNLAKAGEAEYATVAEALAKTGAAPVTLLWDASWAPEKAGDYKIAKGGYNLVIGGSLAYSVKDNGDGTVTVTVAGGEPSEAPAPASITFSGSKVVVGVSDVKSDLWYALEKTTDLTKGFVVDESTWTKGSDLIGGDKELAIALGANEPQAFYRVVVSASRP